MPGSPYRRLAASLLRGGTDRVRALVKKGRQRNRRRGEEDLAVSLGMVDADESTEGNHSYREAVYRLMQSKVELAARAKGKRFGCRALSGESTYNVSINADHTVSCNCNDPDGSGELGDLDTHTFEEVFAGETATRFREELAAGRLPISRCSYCPELVELEAPEAQRRVSEWSFPKGVMVENTAKCNLACTSCSRDTLRRTRRRSRLTLDEMEEIAKTLQRTGVESLCFFKLGEPFASPRVRKELELIRRYNPDMRIYCSTNGILLDNDDKREAALLMDDVIFSIDGVDTQTVRRYQKGGDFDAAYQRMKELVEFRDARGLSKPRISWRYVVFNWNDRPEELERAQELARAAGVDDLDLEFASTPIYGYSWRARLHPYFRQLGEPEGRGRMVRFPRERGRKRKARPLPVVSR